MTDTITALPALTYDTPIRAATWMGCSFARTFTVAGYAAKNGDDVAASLARAAKFGHALVGSIQIGAALLGDRAAAARRMAEDQAIAASAITLASGDLVTIDGIIHTVRFARGNEFAKFPVNSDPISFDRVG